MRSRDSSLKACAAGVLVSLLFANAQADVAIDIGHSTSRPGATSSSGLPEYSFNWLLANSVSKAYEPHGSARVINGDGQIRSLVERTRQAAGTKLFVSIHHDSVQTQFLPVRDARFSGFSLWVSRKNPQYASSVRCAMELSDQLKAAGFQSSTYHADDVPGERRTPVDLGKGIFLNDDLVVLKTAPAPAVLIEAGVIANPIEEQLLRDKDHIKRQAEAIAGGLRRCMAI